MPDRPTYDPKKVTPVEAAVIDAISATLDEVDATTEARVFIDALKEAGFVIVREWRGGSSALAKTEPSS